MQLQTSHSNLTANIMSLAGHPKGLHSTFLWKKQKMQMFSLCLSLGWIISLPTVHWSIKSLTFVYMPLPLLESLRRPFCLCYLPLHVPFTLESLRNLYAYVYDTKQFKLLPNDMGGEGMVAPQIKTKDLVVLPLLPQIISHSIVRW